MKTVMKSGKNNYFVFVDILKIIAMLLVFNSHLDSVYPISSLATGGSLGNSLFFICSGFCISENKKDLKWFVKRILRIYIPTEIVTMLFYRNTKEIFFDFVWPTNFWFVGAIVLFYAGEFLLEKINIFDRFKTFIFTLIVVYFAYYIFLLDTSDWVVEAIGLRSKEGCFKLVYCFAVFMIGAFVRRANYVRGQVYTNFLVAAAAFILMYLSKIMFVVKPRLYHLQFINQFCAVIFAVCFLWGLKLLNEKISRYLVKHNIIACIIEVVSNYTLEVYLLQFVIINFFSKVLFPANLLLIILTLGVASLVLKCLCNVIDSLVFRVIR